MKLQNHYFFLLLAVLGLGIGLVAWEIASSGREEKKYRISVVVDDSRNSRWVPFLEGLKRAAKDNNVYLNYVSTEKMTSLAKEKQVIDKEIKNGTNAVVVQFCMSSGTKSMVTELSRQAVLELVGTDVERDTVSVENCACVAADNTAVGKALADQIAADRKSSEEGMKIGLIAGNTTLDSIRDRLGGFKTAIGAAGGTVSWELKNADPPETLIEQMQQTDPADILVALDDESLIVLDEYVKDTGASVPVYGVGCSDQNVYNLDKGVISAMAVPYEFNMGYQAVVRAVRKLKNPMEEMKNDTIDFSIITKENLFDEENQKLLFPIVQ